MQDLKNYFIAIDREYKEGDVAVFPPEIFWRKCCQCRTLFYGTGGI